MDKLLPVLDLMQTGKDSYFCLSHSFCNDFWTGSSVPALLATLVFALPPVIRLTDLGIRHVDAEIVEAVTAFGYNLDKNYSQLSYLGAAND